MKPHLRGVTGRLQRRTEAKSFDIEIEIHGAFVPQEGLEGKRGKLMPRWSLCNGMHQMKRPEEAWSKIRIFTDPTLPIDCVRDFSRFESPSRWGAWAVHLAGQELSRPICWAPVTLCSV